MLVLNAEQNMKVVNYAGRCLSQASVHIWSVKAQPPGEPHDRNAPFINKDKRCLFLGLPTFSSAAVQGNASPLRT